MADEILERYLRIRLRKAIDLGSPWGFDRAVGKLASLLGATAADADDAAVRAAVGVLDVDWAGTAPGQRRALVARAMEAAGRRTAGVARSVQSVFGDAAREVVDATRVDARRGQGLAIAGKHGGQDNIGVRVGKVVNKYKVAKHFVLEIRDDGFNFHIDEQKVAAEAKLDGIYVIRTSVPAERLSADDTVRSYKSLSQVERAFRSFKTMDLKVRPIHHRLETRVRAHIFLCMLAYCVEWYMPISLR